MPLQNEMIIALIASVMLAMGLALKPQDFIRAVRNPKPLLLILAVNVVVLPLLGWALGKPLSSEMALALLLAGACGVGSTAPLFTANVFGDIALATTAVVVAGFVCLLSLPITLALSGFEMPAGSDLVSIQAISQQAFMTMLMWQVLPLLLGMFVHHHNPALAKRWAGRFKTLGNLALGLLIVGFTVFKGQLFFTIPLSELLLLTLLVLASYGLPMLFRSQPWGSAVLMSISTRNLNLALLLASQVFANDRLLLMILCYSAVMYLLLIPFTMIIRIDQAARVVTSKVARQETA